MASSSVHRLAIALALLGPASAGAAPFEAHGFVRAAAARFEAPVGFLDGGFGKLEAGADFVVTRPVFDPRSFDRVAKRLEDAKLPVLLGLRPLDSVLDAEWMANEMPGSQVPDHVLDRIRRAPSPEAAAAEGIGMARDLYASLKGRVHGVLVTALAGRIDRALDVLD